MLKIVTVATSERFYMKWLKESCIRHGTNLIVLGDGTVWENYLMRFKLVLEYLKTIDDDDVFCFIDAYDVIMTDSADKLRIKFLEFKKTHSQKIIIAFGSKMTFLNKPIPLISDFIEDVCSIDFDSKDFTINAGTYIGFAKDVREVISEMYLSAKPGDTDDQLFFNRYHHLHPNALFVDLEQKWFSVPGEMLDLPDYGSNCFFLHRAACRPLTAYLRANDYFISVEEERELLHELFHELTKKAEYHTLHILKNILK